MLEKLCTKCNQVKPIDCFSKSKRKDCTKGNFKRVYVEKDGYQRYCKECLANNAREFRKRHKQATGNADYRGSGKVTKVPEEHRLLMSFIRKRITDAKANNKRTNRPFNITDDYMLDLFLKQEGLCALTNFPMDINGDSNIKPSIDKIIPDLGYTEGNVQWTVFCANRAKGDLCYEDFISMCKMVIERATTIENTAKAGSE